MQTQTAHTYKSYGIVTILAAEGRLSHIETKDGDTFWVKTELLKTKRVRQNDTAITNAVLPPPPSPAVVEAATPIPVVLATHDELLAFVETHLKSLTASVPAHADERFAMRLQEANGQTYTPGMEGTRRKGSGYSWSFAAVIDTALPESMRPLVEAKQVRRGRCASEPLTAERYVVYCCKLAWELLKRGAKLS